MSIGYIKLHRRLLDWEWYSNVNVRLTFIHCLIVANYEPKRWHGKVIERGQFITSLNNLSKAVGITENKLRTALSKLKKTGEIKVKSTNKNTIITVVNYEVWQGREFENHNQITIKSQSNHNQITTTKEVKKERSKESLKKKNIKKEIPEQSNSLKSKPHSSEEKEKSSAKKEKRTFPDNTPAKSYDPRDKRTDKNIPFDLVSSTKTLEAVYPEIKTLCSEIKQYYGFSINEAEAKERVRGFCSVAITNYSKYRQIRTVDALKDKLLNWISNGIRNGYDTGIPKQPTKDGLPELKLIRKAKRQ